MKRIIYLIIIAAASLSVCLCEHAKCLCEHGAVEAIAALMM